MRASGPNGAGELDDERALRAAIEAGDSDAHNSLGILLAGQRGRERAAEAAYRDAIAAGNTQALCNLGTLLSRLPGREREAEAIYRDAVAAGSTRALCNVGTLLAQQPGREREAEAAYREAAEAGQSDGWLGLGGLAILAGREADAEAAYRAAITAGDTDAWARLGWLLAKQPGREREAEVAYREAIDSGTAADPTLNPASGLAVLLAQQGDVAGARAAFETHARAVAKRKNTELPDAIFAAAARVNTAVARRPRALRLTRSIRGAISRPTRH